MCFYVPTEAAEVAVADEDLELLLTAVWLWHDPLPIAEAA
jgi:hypothetical protein